MFPTGAAGAALLVLRVLVAATLVDNVTAHWAPVSSLWVVWAAALLAIVLCFGFLTPYFSILSCLIQLGMLLVLSEGRSELCLVNSILEGAILAVLGPGAYSVDSRIFGRRLLTLPLPPRK